MRSWRIVAVLLLCLALAGSIACNPFGGNEEEATLQLVEVVRGDLTVSVSGSGNIDVSNEAKLAFGSGGKVDKIYVEEGDEVSKGEVLAKLDTAALELALTQAQLALKEAEYNLKKAKEPYTEQDISNAQAAVDEAENYLEYAQWALERAVLLREKRDSTYRVYNAVTNLGIAERNLDKMLSAPDKDEIAIMELVVVAAKQSLAQAQKQLDEATLTAPFDGVVASVDADEGDTVLATEKIIHLIDLTSMELSAEVDEIDIPEVKLGQRVIIEVDTLPTLQLEGKVISISLLPEVEAGVVLYKVKIGFDVPPDLELKIGMSAEADIIIQERSNILLVPSRAIKHDSQGNPVVEVMVNEQIEERPVVIGISDGFQTEIIDGLDEGEVVLRKTS